MDIPAAPGFKDAAARSDRGGCFFGILCSSEKSFAFSWYTVEGGCFLACYVVLKKVSLSAATPSKDTEIYIQECDKTETKGPFGTMGKIQKGSHPSLQTKSGTQTICDIAVGIAEKELSSLVSQTGPCYFVREEVGVLYQKSGPCWKNSRSGWVLPPGGRLGRLHQTDKKKTFYFVLLHQLIRG
jgi:hypothetical protein